MPLSLILSDGAGDRAAIVGWIFLAIAVGAAIFFGVAMAVIAGESAMDRLARFAPPGSVQRWAFLIAGVALLAVGFIVASWGVAIAGGLALFVFWRLVEHEAV